MQVRSYKDEIVRTHRGADFVPTRQEVSEGLKKGAEKLVSQCRTELWESVHVDAKDWETQVEFTEVTSDCVMAQVWIYNTGAALGFDFYEIYFDPETYELLEHKLTLSTVPGDDEGAYTSA